LERSCSDANVLGIIVRFRGRYLKKVPVRELFGSGRVPPEEGSTTRTLCFFSSKKDLLVYYDKKGVV